MKLKYPESIEIIRKTIKDERIHIYLENLKWLGDVYVHSKRVGALSVDLGLENLNDEDDINVLAYSGLLHDNGKSDMDDIINAITKIYENREALGKV